MPRQSRQDISKERKNQILDAATTVFAREGFHDARMEDIADESGLSKGALYLYYKSKDAIIAALLRRLFALELRGLRAVTEGGGGATERLLAMTAMFATDFDRMAFAMPVMLEFSAVAARQRSVRQYLGESLEKYAAVLSGLIQDGVASGEFRPVNVEGVAMTLTALGEGVVLLWVMVPRAMHLREQLEAALRLVLEGIGVR
jgi:AcrR family transcriptional regulator